MALLWFGSDNFSSLYEGVNSYLSSIGGQAKLIHLVLFSSLCVILFVLIRRSDSIFDGVISKQNTIINMQHERLDVRKKELNHAKAAFDRNIVDLTETKTKLREKQNILECFDRFRTLSSTGGTRELLYDSILQEMLKLTDSRYGFIGMFKNAEETASFLCSLNLQDNDADKMDAGQAMDRPLGAHPYSIEELSSGPVIINGLNGKKKVSGFPDDHPPFDNYLSIPLRSAGRLVGVLGLANRADGYALDMPENITLAIEFCSELIENKDGQEINARVHDLLMESADLKDGILRAMGDVVITFDDGGIVAGLNAAGEALFDIATMEIAGTKIGNLLDLPGWTPGYPGGFDLYLATDSLGLKDERVKLSGRTKAGKEFPVELQVVPCKIDGQKFYYAIFADRSDIRKSEEALAIAREETQWLELQRKDIQKEIAESRHAEQLALANIEKIERSSRTKFELLANMTGELCTPLTAIVGFSDSILKGVFGDIENSELLDYIEHINDSGRKLREHITETLDLSGIEIGKMGIDPDDAIAISDYAKFAAYVRHEHDMVEALFQRALEMDPGNPTILSNYSIFRTSIRNDHEREDTLYKYAIEADPDSALAHGNYAVFLSDVRKHHDRAEEFYKSAIKLDPGNAGNLFNYASFLTGVHKYHDRAETFFKRAIDAEPDNAIFLGHYARFVNDVRGNEAQAIELFERAIEADQNALHVQLEYAMLLLFIDDAKKGTGILEEIIPRLAGEDLIKALFYEYAYSRSTAERTKALGRISELLEVRVRSPLFDPFQDIRRLIDDGHADGALLEALARVITVRAELKSLDKFPKWKSLKGGEVKEVTSKKKTGPKK